MQNNINPCYFIPTSPDCGGSSSGGSTPSYSTIAACNLPYNVTGTPIPVGQILTLFNPDMFMKDWTYQDKLAATENAATAGLSLSEYLISNVLANGYPGEISASLNSNKYITFLKNHTDTPSNVTSLKYIVGTGTTIYDPSYPPCSSSILAMVSDFFNNFGGNQNNFTNTYGSLASNYVITLSSALSSTTIPSLWIGALVKFLATSVANYNAGVAIGDIDGTVGYASKTTLDFFIDTTSAISLASISNVGTIKLSFAGANTFNMIDVDNTLTTLEFYSTTASPTITNLNSNPLIKFTDVSGTVSPSITYMKGVMTSPGTLSLVFDDAAITTLTINKASTDTSDLFNNIVILSKCSDTDNPNTITTFTSTAINNQISLLTIDPASNCGFTLPFGTDVTTVSNVLYTGNSANMPAIITFASTSAGVLGSPVVMTLPEGSTVGFARTDKLDINDGTSVTFVGGNGTLQIVTAAFPTASVTSKYSGVTGLITTTAFTAGTLDMSLIAGSTGLKTLTATATTSFPTAVFLTNLADTFTLNFGTATTRLDTTDMMAGTAKFTAVSGCSSCVMNMNFYPTTGDVLTNTFSLATFKTLNLNISSVDASGIAASTITLTAGGVVNTINLTGSGTALTTAVALTLTVTAATSLATLDASDLGDINVGLTYTVTSTGLTTLKGSSVAANTLTGHASVATILTITGGTAADTFTSGVGGGAWTITGKGGADTFKITSTTTGTLMTITDFNPGTSTTAVDKLNIKYGVNLLGLGSAVLITGAGTAADVAAAGGFTFTSTSSTTATITAGTNGAAFVYTGGTLTTSSTVSGFSIGASDTGCVALVYKSGDDGYVHVGLLYYSAATTASSLTDVFILQNVTDVTLIDATDLLSIA